MKNLMQSAGLAAAVVTLSACATMPDTSGMTELNESEVRELISGKTIKASYDWGNHVLPA